MTESLPLLSDFDSNGNNTELLLTDRESLLTSALVAVVEALRMNPNRYAVIYNNSYDNNESVFDNSSTTVSSSPPHSPILQNQNYYYNEYHEGLVELAKGFLKLLLNQLVDKTMVAVLEGNRR